MVRTYSKARGGDTQLAPNFRLVEFIANCAHPCCTSNDEVLLDDRLPQVLQRIREVCGRRPLSVTSGYRNVAHNTRIGGAPNSFHTRGMAADITVSGVAPLDVCRAAETALAEAKIPGGICLYTQQSFVHIDVRDVKWRGQNDGDGRGERTVSGWTPMPAPEAAVPSAPQEAGNDKIIWDFFTAKDTFTPQGIAGLMGNLYAESGLIPTNLENKYEKEFGMTDAQYTAAVDSGAYANFARDSAGYGLAQWTFWARKEALLTYARATNRSIGDLQMQLEFLWIELQSYGKVMNTLRNTSSVLVASNIVLTEFERPADMGSNVQARRAEYGQRYYDKFAGHGGDPPAATQQSGSYNVRVTGAPLNIRTGPGTDNPISGQVMDNGIYTVMQDADGPGASKWGKIKTGQDGAQSGWISLDHAVRA